MDDKNTQKNTINSKVQLHVLLLGKNSQTKSCHSNRNLQYTDFKTESCLVWMWLGVSWTNFKTNFKAFCNCLHRKSKCLGITHCQTFRLFLTETYTSLLVDTWQQFVLMLVTTWYSVKSVQILQTCSDLV